MRTHIGRQTNDPSINASAARSEQSKMFVPALVHLVLATTCTDHDIGLSLSTKYQTRVAAEAAALHADGGQCNGCCDDHQRTESVYGNCSVDLPLLALTKGMSLHKACHFVRTTLFVYTGSAHLRAFMSAMEADVPAGLSGEADLMMTWCGFTCSPTCAGHPPSSPPALQQSNDGDLDPLFGAIAHMSTLDRSLGWVAWLWVGLIAAQAAAALLVYARHRRFLAQLRAHTEWSRHMTRHRPGSPASGMLLGEDEVVAACMWHVCVACAWHVHGARLGAWCALGWLHLRAYTLLTTAATT